MQFSRKFAVLLAIGGMAGLGLDIATAQEQGPSTAGVDKSYQSFGRGRVPFDAALGADGQIVVVGRGGLLSVLAKDAQSVLRNLDLTKPVNFLSVARGPDGLLRTTDGEGRIWVINAELEKTFPEFDDGQSAFFSLQYLADGYGIAVGEFGSVRVKGQVSDDWLLQEFDWPMLLPKLSERVGDVAPHLYRICPREAGGALIVGEYGVVLELAASQWSVSQVGQDVGNLFACLVTPSGMEVVAGQSGKLFFRIDASSSWQVSDSAIETDIYDLAYSDGALLAVGQGGVVQGSLDGRHWALSDTVLPGTDWIVRALPVNDGVLLVGKQGYLLIDSIRRLTGINVGQRAAVIHNDENR